MAAGIALSEDDRRPWLDAVAAAAERQVAQTGGAVVACSALRRDYRDRLRAGLRSCVFIHLAGPKYLIEQRLANRQDHFVGKALLESQLKTLEPLEKGEAGFTLDISLPVGVLVQKAMDQLRQYQLAAEDAVTVTDGE
ncbi:gluconokinase [Roseibium salinum]|nr:gluconokinase [Roseibium salinum]